MKLGYNFFIKNFKFSFKFGQYILGLIPCLLYRVYSNCKVGARAERRKVKDTWGPRFQKGGKLRSAWGYVVSGRCICRGGGTMGEYNCKLGLRELG